MLIINLFITKSHISGAGLEFTSRLKVIFSWDPIQLKCCDFRHEPLCLLYVVLMIKPKVLCVLGEHSTHSTTHSAHILFFSNLVCIIWSVCISFTSAPATTIPLSTSVSQTISTSECVWDHSLIVSLGLCSYWLFLFIEIKLFSYSVIWFCYSSSSNSF